MTEAIVLCGGFGTRLNGVLGDLPKGLAPLRGRPFLEWQLLYLRGQGVRDVVLATGHGAAQIEAALGDGSRLGLRMRYSREQTPLGTGGAVRLAFEHVAGPSALVVNGDTWCLFDLQRLQAAHSRSGALITIWLAPADPDNRYGSVAVSDAGRVLSFAEKSRSDSGVVNAGVYLVERRAFQQVPGKPFSLERDLLPTLSDGRLHAVSGHAPLVDIGTPEAYHRAAQAMAEDSELAALDDEADVRGYLAGSADAMREASEQASAATAQAARLISAAFQAGGKLLLCGNGGSAADCQHMAAELTSSLHKDRRRSALPAIALTTDTSFLTAYANDYGFEGVFERQVEALGRPGDVLLLISTSGRSPNIVRAAETARQRGLATVALLGRGSELAASVDCAVELPGDDTQRIQEAMLAVEHAICSLVERWSFGQD